jgi:hypothetical protein
LGKEVPEHIEEIGKDATDTSVSFIFNESK